jgi:hypothetical protein
MYSMPDKIKPLDEDLLRWRIIRIHPVWCSFILHCENLRYGEIERLENKDRLPMIAEAAKKKAKFSGENEN